MTFAINTHEKYKKEKKTYLKIYHNYEKQQEKKRKRNAKQNKRQFFFRLKSTITNQTISFSFAYGDILNPKTKNDLIFFSSNHGSYFHQN